MQLSAGAPMMLGATDVETLTLTSPDDPAGMAEWAILAAQGFRVAAALDRGGKILLLLERPPSPITPQSRPPAAVTAQPEQLAALEARLRQVREERLRAIQGIRYPQGAAAPLAPAPVPTKAGEK